MRKTSNQLAGGSTPSGCANVWEKNLPIWQVFLLHPALQFNFRLFFAWVCFFLIRRIYLTFG